MIVTLLYHHIEYLRGGPYCSAFPSHLGYDSWIHYPDTTQWLDYCPGGSPIKVFDGNVGRGPFLPSFITPFETNMASLIELRASQLEEFLPSDG